MQYNILGNHHNGPKQQGSLDTVELILSLSNLFFKWKKLFFEKITQEISMIKVALSHKIKEFFYMQQKFLTSR